ncbi:hypothetical protein I2F17_11710 [Acinetobacter sp. B10A]|uniref:hypothetical protein n=1 Tax=Acinetobacter baretiae TaxID=2605383 RepID=UPI001B3C84F8|nr:hypothetical protein [Acinetobacter baretiae]MBF7686484.1 hypothetical protein [Acinetobacter baretiae]
MKKLEHALNNLEYIHDKEYNSVYLDPDHYSPGYICALAAYVDKHQILEKNFDTDSHNMSYLKTIGFHESLWKTHQKPYRTNCGKNYSPLIPLKDMSDVNNATTTINGCIRNLLGNHKHTTGISLLFNVIGELNDNVWSHGKFTGYSMAQKTFVPNTQKTDSYIEFALVDRGIGFLAELNRIKSKIKSHSEAIAWCIKEGNSTKHSDNVDTWTQRLPDDHVGNDPMCGFGGEVPENHHQGLGLGHLIKLIKQYNGELQLCTGDSLYKVYENGCEEYKTTKYHWQGVAISCRFKSSNLLRNIKMEGDKGNKDLFDRLRSISK